MSNLLRLTVLFLFTCCACRSLEQATLSEDAAPTYSPSNVPRLNSDFDWLQSVENGRPVSARNITYCYTPSMLEDYNNTPKEKQNVHFKEAFERSVARVNAFLEKKNIRNWKLTLDNNKPCPDGNAFLLQKTPNTFPHLRVRLTDQLNTPPTGHGTGSYTIDDIATDGTVLTNMDIDRQGAQVPPGTTNPNASLSEFGAFIYEQHNPRGPLEFYILTGEIAFNGSKKISWSTEPGSPEAFDPDIVAMHMIGHALRLNHEPKKNSIMRPFIRSGDRWADQADPSRYNFSLDEEQALSLSDLLPGKS